jgi:1-acylglycerone phosphate reductase
MSEQQRQKVALVTGGSSGIGFSVSKELATKGFKVYAAARRLEPMEPLKEFGVIPVKLDVASLESVLELKKYLTEELKEGKLDVLYNNAGQSCTLPAVDVTDEQVAQAFQVNVFGPIRLTRELSQFVINAKGTILFTGSIAGDVPFPFSTIYCSTKAAIHQYARVLHLELKGFGVRVINVVTGGVHTNIADTRAIPKGSLYDIPEAQKAFQGRKTMAVENLPMSSEKYAKKVVSDILSSRDPVDVYRGSFATIMTTAVQYLPRWVIEFILTTKFKLSPMFKAQRDSNTVDLHLE